jgi:8-oxo-dGTP pyrophosphatase MutT (NUDIX family)
MATTPGTHQNGSTSLQPFNQQPFAMNCPHCHAKIPTFRNPVPTVDIIIEIGPAIVLIKRRNPPHGWALPGGFVDYGESFETAAAREALEETGLTVQGLRQFTPIPIPVVIPASIPHPQCLSQRRQARPRRGTTRPRPECLQRIIFPTWPLIMATFSPIILPPKQGPLPRNSDSFFVRKQGKSLELPNFERTNRPSRHHSFMKSIISSKLARR